MVRNANYYPTWQEAQKAIEKLRKEHNVRIEKKDDYHAHCYLDTRLPKYPNERYKDFPGYKKYLGTEFYPTWQEASKAAIKLGIKTQKEYRKKRDADKKLPGAPRRRYKKFPGWRKFLGKI